jgi:hypothetical protein
MSKKQCDWCKGSIEKRPYHLTIMVTGAETHEHSWDLCYNCYRAYYSMELAIKVREGTRIDEK